MELQLTDNKLAEALSTISDEVLASFSFPIYTSVSGIQKTAVDADGFHY